MATESKYTEEMVDFLSTEYTTKRDAGELNRDILEFLVDAVAEKFGVQLTVPGIRAKLNSTSDGDGFVYRKDTDAEKEVLNARKPGAKKEKVAKRTKKDIALAILEKIGADVSLAADLSRAKADTLAALEKAVNRPTV